MTFELVAENGPAQDAVDPVFRALDRDTAESLDGVWDQANLPLHAEPKLVLSDFTAITSL